MIPVWPWVVFVNDPARFWIYYGFVIGAFVFVVITFIAQVVKPAPYGRFANADNNPDNWGPVIPQRLGHTLSDALPCVVGFLLVCSLSSNHLSCNMQSISDVLFLDQSMHLGIAINNKNVFIKYPKRFLYNELQLQIIFIQILTS